MSVVADSVDGGGAFDLPGHDILDVLGYKGFVVIYRARQRSLNRIVAIHTLRAGASGAATRCLRREADILARFGHPHVVSILDCIERGGRIYQVFELFEGGTLAERISGHPQPARPAATLIERLARTLAHIHRSGIIHCNLKPRNVLFAAPPPTSASGRADTLDYEDVYGIPLLADFELALESRELGELKEGEIRGTPAYMAPEQAQARHHELGPATDIYGLGTVLYELLTGRPPFQGTSPIEVLIQAREREPEAPHKFNPHVDRKLEAICLKCLSKEPGQRYSGGLALASDLRRLIGA
jgi:eukaryotic-like serine/threonine-protein kinase